MNRSVEISEVRCTDYDYKRFRLFEVYYTYYLNDFKVMEGIIYVTGVSREDIKNDDILKTIIELGENKFAYRAINGEQE